MRMVKIFALQALAVTAFAAVSAVFGSEMTVSALIRQDPEASLLWKTVMTPEVEVMLDWPAGATHAVLSVDGEVRATVSDASVTSTNLSFALPSAPADEKVVMLSVSYLDAEEAVVGSDEAQLGLVCSLGASVAIPVRKADSGAWHKAGATSAVLPVLENAATLSIGGATVLTSPTAPSWYWWHPIGGAATTLALTLEDSTAYENRVRGIVGTSFIIR